MPRLNNVYGRTAPGDEGVSAQLKDIQDTLADLKSEVLVLKEVTMTIMDIIPTVNDIDLHSCTSEELANLSDECEEIIASRANGPDAVEKATGKDSELDKDLDDFTALASMLKQDAGKFAGQEYKRFEPKHDPKVSMECKRSSKDCDHDGDLMPPAFASPYHLHIPEQPSHFDPDTGKFYRKEA